MTSFNKVWLASDMFVEAHDRYMNAKKELDYIVSILLSWAVVGIVSPLLKEQGGHTTHELLARISNAISDPSEEPAREGMFREIYNSLKHAGNAQRKIAASGDLEIKTDLKKEAAHMLDAAKSDFREIEVPQEIRNNLSAEFLVLLQSEDSYA